MTINVRFAPSPTGSMHIGNLRTALFNKLFALKHNGNFILRVEDSDRERSSALYEKEIIDILKLTNLIPDKGLVNDRALFLNSNREELYLAKFNELLQKGFIYPCFCSESQLDEMRKNQLENGIYPHYDGRCFKLDDETFGKKIENGENCVYRFKLPERENISFTDGVFGEKEFPVESLGGDFIIRRTDGTWTYNFTVVVDDIDMNITDVVRGVDHLTNTARQIAIYEALSGKIPNFYHLPLIVNDEGKKLSKRESGGSVTELFNSGIVPEALVNYLYFLGYKPESEKEILSFDEMLELFDITRISKAPSKWDNFKLAWFNEEYFKTIPLERLGKVLELPSDELLSELRTECKKRDEFKEWYTFLKEDKVSKISENIMEKDIFELFITIFEEKCYDKNGVEILNTIKKESGLKGKTLFHNLRVFITGMEDGISLSFIFSHISKEHLKKIFDLRKKQISL